jgi:hypothetical protein
MRSGSAVLKAVDGRPTGAMVKEMSVLTGKRIQRAEIGGPGEFDHFTDDELLVALRERFAFVLMVSRKPGSAGGKMGLLDLFQRDTSTGLRANTPVQLLTA